MMNQSIFPIISIINIFLLVFSTFNLFRRRHIINLLVSFSILSLAVLESAEFSLFFNFVYADKILGLGFCLSALFWLIASASFLPVRSYPLSRSILSPIFGLLTVGFFFIWWIHPFITVANIANGSRLSILARYFFVLVVLDLILAFSNLE